MNKKVKKLEKADAKVHKAKKKLFKKEEKLSKKEEHLHSAVEKAEHKKKPSKKKKKVEKVMHEWKEGELHSGSKKGPIVKNQKQAIAIALSEARKAGAKIKKKKK